MSEPTDQATQITWRAPAELLARLDERRLAHPDKLSRNEWINRMVVYVLDNIHYDPSGIRRQHTYINESGGVPGEMGELGEPSPTPNRGAMVCPQAQSHRQGVYCKWCGATPAK